MSDEAFDNVMRALYIASAVLALYITVDFITEGALSREAIASWQRMREHLDKEDRIKKAEARVVFEAMEALNDEAAG